MSQKEQYIAAAHELTSVPAIPSIPSASASRILSRRARAAFRLIRRRSTSPSLSTHFPDATDSFGVVTTRTPEHDARRGACSICLRSFKCRARIRPAVPWYVFDRRGVTHRTYYPKHESTCISKYKYITCRMRSCS